MSYILDALKKAESDRKLGSIPTVHAQSMPSTTNNADLPGWRKRLPWLLTLLMSVLVAWVGWLQPWRSQPAPAANPPSGSAPPTAQTMENPVPVAPPAASAPASPALKSAAPEHVDQPARSAMAPRAPASSPKIASVDTKAVAPEADHVEQKSVGTLQDLPENIQRELPAIVVNGYIYARNPADRSVLINKRLLHEGDQIGPELVLEKMTPNGAVLSYKGYRYRVPY
jgi:general secretion pathway protein B